MGIGLPLLLIALTGVRVMLAAYAAMAVLFGVAMIWSPSRHYLADRAWCVITPRRVRVGCPEDFASALPLLVAACWARGIRVTGNSGYAHLVALDVIRRLWDDYPGTGEPSRHAETIPAPRAPPDDADGPQPWPVPPGNAAVWNPYRHPDQ